MPTPRHHDYVSRAGVKLAHAFSTFRLSPEGAICADLGSSTGGFTDCLLRHGASKVFAVERGYGVLDYRLRSDRRVVVMERTDALNVTLPESVTLVTIDTGWTRQALILPVAARLLDAEGHIISLVKPHYEAPPEWIVEGLLPDEFTERTIAPIRERLPELGLMLVEESESPIRGQRGNRELLWLLRIKRA